MAGWRALVVLLVFLGHAIATIYIPPVAIERAGFYIYQNFYAGLRNFQPQTPFIGQVVRALIATATGSYVAHQVQNVQRSGETGVLRVPGAYLEDLAESVVQVRVWPPREAVLRDAYRDLRASHPWYRRLERDSGVTDVDYAHGILIEGFPYVPPAVGTAPTVEEATAIALAEYESWEAVYPDWTGWLFEGAAAHGFTGLRTSEQWSERWTWYTEGPEVLVDYVRRWHTQEAWAVGTFVYVRPTPPATAVVTNDYEVWAFPSSIYFVFAVPWIYRIVPDLDWCRNVENRITGVAFYFVKLDYDYFQYASPVGPVYRVAGAGGIGAVAEYRGYFPRAEGDGRLWYYQIRRLFASADSALTFTAWDASTIGNVWTRVCAGMVAGVEPGVLPWDVRGAPDFGTAVRRRDGALVWWLVRPVEALRAAFVPSVGLDVRLSNLLAYASERFPWSVYAALRVPPAVEVSPDGLELPCFSVGNRYELCPNDSLVRAVGIATRAGFGLVALVGVGMWLGRRVTPLLRL